MTFVLSTPRLFLRNLSTADASHFYELNNDPEVLRYTGDLPFSSLEQARHFLETYDHYEKYGYGRWAVILKEVGEFIGWCGLKFHPHSGETDLGFRFFRRYWGKGYATEAALACAEYGLRELNLGKIIGRAMKSNLASIRVLEKCGFIFKNEYLEEGQIWVCYHSYDLLGRENLRKSAGNKFSG